MEPNFKSIKIHPLTK